MRVDQPQILEEPGRGTHRAVYLGRRLVQPASSALRTGVPITHEFREETHRAQTSRPGTRVAHLVGRYVASADRRRGQPCTCEGLRIKPIPVRGMGSTSAATSAPTCHRGFMTRNSGSPTVSSTASDVARARNPAAAVTKLQRTAPQHPISQAKDVHPMAKPHPPTSEPSSGRACHALATSPVTVRDTSATRAAFIDA